MLPCDKYTLEQGVLGCLMRILTGRALLGWGEGHTSFLSLLSSLSPSLLDLPGRFMLEIFSAASAPYFFTLVTCYGYPGLTIDLDIYNARAFISAQPGSTSASSARRDK